MPPFSTFSKYTFQQQTPAAFALITAETDPLISSFLYWVWTTRMGQSGWERAL